MPGAYEKKSVNSFCGKIKIIMGGIVYCEKSKAAGNSDDGRQEKNYQTTVE